MGGRGLANKKPTAWVEEGGRRKKTNDILITFFMLGVARPFMRKSAASRPKGRTYLS